MIRKSAILSNDRAYRYTLERIWTTRKPYCLFVCLNPSSANENYDDPTVRRCLSFSESFGCGGLIIVNLFAYRCVSPLNLFSAYDPVGSENDYYIKKMAADAGITIAAWGAHPVLPGRDEEVLPLLKEPQYLELTKNGYPRHPLYLKKDLRPKPFKV